MRWPAGAGGRRRAEAAARSEPLSVRMDSPHLMRITGDLDQAAVPALHSALETYGAADPLTIDLSETSYLCSLAVSALVGAMRAAEATGRRLRLQARAGAPAQQVLQVLVIPHDVLDG